MPNCLTWFCPQMKSDWCSCFGFCVYLPSPPLPGSPSLPFPLVFFTLLGIVSRSSAFISNHLLPCISGPRSLETGVRRCLCLPAGSGRQRKESHFPIDIQAAIHVGFGAYSRIPASPKLRAERQLLRKQVFPAVSWPRGISSNFMISICIVALEPESHTPELPSFGISSDWVYSPISALLKMKLLSAGNT